MRLTYMGQKDLMHMVSILILSLKKKGKQDNEWSKIAVVHIFSFFFKYV